MAISHSGKIISQGGKTMSEPTREQIKEAFKQTIERWEKIIGSLSYKEERWVNITKDCRFDLEGDEFFKIKDKDGSLISIQRNKAQVSYSVGKREHGELTVVFGPPRAGYKFEINRFKNFEILKKLGTEKDCKAKGIGLTEPAATEEKKEEWEDITEKVVLTTEKNDGGQYFLRISYQQRNIGIIYKGQLNLYDLTYKVEYSGYTTKILKKK